MLASRKATKTSDSTTKKFAAKGVTYQDGKLSVKTDRPAVTRDDQVASAQAAVARTKDQLRSRPDAFYNKDSWEKIRRLLTPVPPRASRGPRSSTRCDVGYGRVTHNDTHKVHNDTHMIHTYARWLTESEFATQE